MKITDANILIKMHEDANWETNLSRKTLKTIVQYEVWEPRDVNRHRQISR